MPIETPHPLYSANLERWTRCRDAYEGEDAVKAGGAKYLPKIDPSQTAGEYNAYIARALYYEAVARTVDGFVGAISRKPHVIELPDKLKALETDATTDGTGLAELIKKLAGEVLLVARCGVLVDYDDVAQRAYLAFYQAESILSWKQEAGNTVSVVLQETVYESDPKDAFNQISIDQIRQLHIDNGFYTVTVWRKSAATVAGAEWVIHETIVPTKRAAGMAELPWFWFSTMGRSSGIAKPPMLGLVNVALSHYRSSADLEHGRHFTALPTLWVTGIKSDDPVSVGAGSLITLSDPAARVGYAEFRGEGLGSLEKALEAKESQMATLGAAIWSQRKGVEAAETARIRTAGENSLLMGTVSAVEEALTAALEFAAEWMNVAGEITLQINRDFIDQQIDAQTLVGMVQAYQAGAMSLEAFLYCLQQSEMLPPDTEIEDEVTKLNAASAAKAAASAKVALQVAKTVPAAPAQIGGANK